VTTRHSSDGHPRHQWLMKSVAMSNADVSFRPTLLSNIVVMGNVDVVMPVATLSYI
jgi:hypothetical protein